MTKIKWLGIIRITGLLLVLVYHFFQDTLPGGFIGVDVFFTLSGYLITMSIMEEFQANGNFRLFGFYKRRFMRIYPPLALSILFTLPFTLLLSPDFTANIKRQIAAALGFVTNYFEIAGGGSYEAQMLPHLFLHTWFLAVEMHLYLIWGLFCAVIALLLKKMYRASPGKSAARLRVVFIAASTVGALVSYLRMQILYNGAVIDPSIAYFDTGARAFPFMLGACAAGVFHGFSSKQKKEKKVFLQILEAFFLLCALLILTGGLIALARTLHFSGKEAYRFGFAAASLLTVFIIRLILVLHDATPGIREPRILTAAANLSYAIYLLHWPLYTVVFYTMWNNIPAAGIALAGSILFSALLSFGLEPLFHGQRPLQTLRPPVLRRASRLAVSMSTLAALALSCFVAINAPEINSLEEQLYAGYLYQDIDKIGLLQNLREAVNGEPLFPLGELSITGAVQKGLPGVIIVGDSVCLGARKKLTEAIPNSVVDAEGSRQFIQGYNLLMELQNSGSLGEYVVVALGVNQNPNSLPVIDQIIADIKPGHRLIFVTPYNGAMKEHWITYKIIQYLRTLPEKHPFVTVADWAALAELHPRFLGVDKIHIGGMPASINLYANCIIEAINAAAAKPAKQ